MWKTSKTSCDRSLSLSVQRREARTLERSQSWYQEGVHRRLHRATQGQRGREQAAHQVRGYDDIRSLSSPRAKPPCEAICQEPSTSQTAIHRCEESLSSGHGVEARSGKALNRQEELPELDRHPVGIHTSGDDRKRWRRRQEICQAKRRRSLCWRNCSRSGPRRRAVDRRRSRRG